MEKKVLMFLGPPLKKDTKSGKIFYRKLSIGGHTFKLHDFVHLKGVEKEFPYIGIIQEFYKRQKKYMVRVRWMFRPRDTHLNEVSKLADFGKNEISMPKCPSKVTPGHAL